MFLLSKLQINNGDLNITFNNKDKSKQNYKL